MASQAECARYFKAIVFIFTYISGALVNAVHCFSFNVAA